MRAPAPVPLRVQIMYILFFSLTCEAAGIRTPLPCSLRPTHVTPIDAFNVLGDGILFHPPPNMATVLSVYLCTYTQSFPRSSVPDRFASAHSSPYMPVFPFPAYFSSSYGFDSLSRVSLRPSSPCCHALFLKHWTSARKYVPT